jgi:hypothetical protein
MEAVNENGNETFMGEPGSNEAFMEEPGSHEAFVEETSNHFLATNTPPGCLYGGPESKNANPPPENMPCPTSESHTHMYVCI